MRYLVTIAYDGSNFFGFQRLKGKRSVQEEIEKALTIINKKEVTVKGAGRTDKGVHAYGQRIHFELEVRIPNINLKSALNSLLPPDVRVIEVENVSNDTHARFSVKRKIYQYKINNGSYDPLLNSYYYQIPYKVNITKLKQCSKLFIGVHNFKNFVSGERDNYEAIIYSINIEKHDDFIIITFEGKSFYRYMVRNMVGTMLDVATNKKTIEDVKEMLDNYNKEKTPTCAPAQGLYLMQIFY